LPQVPSTIFSRSVDQPDLSISYNPDPPAEGERITTSGDALNVPDTPIIPYIEGDGVGAGRQFRRRGVPG
jgi:hypothetical protein